MPMIAVAQSANPASAATPASAAPAAAATAGPNTNTGPVTWADFLTSCQTPGQVALTYSEGPSEATMEMLETLKEAQATVTFFTNATWLQYMQYAGVTRHAYLDGHLIGMTYRLPSDTSAGRTDNEIQEDIARASRTIQDLIGVYPRYMKIHESNLKDSRLLNLVKSMGYTLVGFNMDEYDYKYNSAATSSQIAEVFNAMFTKQMDAYGRKASYVVAGYDVPTTGAASGLPKVINTIQAHAYDMVRLDGCTNDKTPYKKDPILNNGYVGDAKSFGAAEYKHGQKSVNFTPGGGGGNQQSKGASPVGGNDGKSTQDTTSKKSAGSRLSAVASVMAIIPALAIAYML
ncbi:chitin deacetylase [Linnemannia gamsii]|uniref:Chitin deacetylase n=1 Tax=Linnemannia gamsii TaxID=64522 RepID=A0ABQ7K479_9FUNG|nr:chitin deacetylase [Linnemannia gamsii]